MCHKGENWSLHIGFGGNPSFEKHVSVGAGKLIFTDAEEPECTHCYKWCLSKEWEYENPPTNLCPDCRLFKRVLIIKVPRFPRIRVRRIENWD